MNTKSLPRRFRLRCPRFWTGRIRRRLAVGQIDDSDSIALPRQFRQRSTAGDFHIVRMAHGDHSKWFFDGHR